MAGNPHKIQKHHNKEPWPRTRHYRGKQQSPEKVPFLRDDAGEIIICPSCESWRVGRGTRGDGEFRCKECSHRWEGAF
jgi:hypothetical protein